MSLLLADLPELKTQLDIDPDDPTDDKQLLYFTEAASAWIEELLDRPLLYKARTQYYSGTGTKKLLLKCRPVFTTPTIQVNMSDAGYYGQTDDSFDSTTALVYGDDFFLQVDQDDGSSRSGILIMRNGYWRRPFVRQPGLLAPFVGDALGNIRVTYTAGFKTDTLPMPLRLAGGLLIARLRSVFPHGVEVNSDSFETTNLGIVTSEKQKLLALVNPLIWPYRNWSFGGG